MKNIVSLIENFKIVPVVTVQRTEDAENIFGALINGGLPVAEVCFRTGCAEEAIRSAVKTYPQMLVGAGTVINAEQCRGALAAGAKFIVSPGFSEEVATVCTDKGVLYLPGVITPTEIMKALSFGLTYLKFFPAENFGGLNMIRALSAAFPQVRFMPTGGISPENIKEYLSFPQIFACGGSWMMKGNIEKNCKEIIKYLSYI